MKSLIGNLPRVADGSFRFGRRRHDTKIYRGVDVVALTVSAGQGLVHSVGDGLVQGVEWEWRFEVVHFEAGVR